MNSLIIVLSVAPLILLGLFLDGYNVGNAGAIAERLDLLLLLDQDLLMDSVSL